MARPDACGPGPDWHAGPSHPLGVDAHHPEGGEVGQLATHLQVLALHEQALPIDRKACMLVEVLLEARAHLQNGAAAPPPQQGADAHHDQARLPARLEQATGGLGRGVLLESTLRPKQAC